MHSIRGYSASFPERAYSKIFLNRFIYSLSLFGLSPRFWLFRTLSEKSQLKMDEWELGR